ncbi:MAG: hypothetical protein IJW75_01515 [Alphaproteobacteria bacterium]|nr:hypothetical protein [Alphaproteobacteria bacterium]
MKKIFYCLICFLFLCGFTPLSSLRGSLFVSSKSADWEVSNSGANIRAFNQKAKVELIFNLSDLLPNSPYCVSNKRIKDIKFRVSIHKIAKKGETDWEKSFGRTKIYFSGKGGSRERRVYGSNLIKNNIKASGGVINVGTLEFLSPITCENIDNMTMRILGMKDGRQNIQPLTFTINLKKK